MNKEYADQLVESITKILSGHKLATVSSTPLGLRQQINETFTKSYHIKHPSNNTYSVAIVDSYGVMTGANQWELDADKRSIKCKTTNCTGDLCQFTWTIQDPDPEDVVWDIMREEQRKLREIK